MGKWTEEQRAKFMATMKRKYGTNYEDGRKVSHGQMKVLAKTMARKVKKTSKPRETGATSIVVNGWRVTLSPREIRIDRDE